VEHILENGWVLEPAGGLTGEAFIASHENKKLFIKRNSSPFLAVLSAEGIVPKLIWTKRSESGDVFTAQKWIKGRKLEPNDMSGEDVAKLLKKIHRSKPLLSMMKRLGKTPFSPEILLTQLQSKLNANLIKEFAISKTIGYLEQHVPEIRPNNWAVCHGDMNHNNWMITEENELFLIDWESAIIGDPAFDLGPLLYWYVPEGEWENWLNNYGMSLTESIYNRLKWYVYYQTLLSIQFFDSKGNEKDRIFWLEYLDTIK